MVTILPLTQKKNQELIQEFTSSRRGEGENKKKKDLAQALTFQGRNEETRVPSKDKRAKRSKQGERKNALFHVSQCLACLYIDIEPCISQPNTLLLSGQCSSRNRNASSQAQTFTHIILSQLYNPTITCHKTDTSTRFAKGLTSPGKRRLRCRNSSQKPTLEEVHVRFTSHFCEF